MAKCWDCGKSFSVPEGEEGEHGCPNIMCSSYDLVEDVNEDD